MRRACSRSLPLRVDHQPTGLSLLHRTLRRLVPGVSPWCPARPGGLHGVPRGVPSLVVHCEHLFCLVRSGLRRVAAPPLCASFFVHRLAAGQPGAAMATPGFLSFSGVPALSSPTDLASDRPTGPPRPPDRRPPDRLPLGRLAAARDRASCLLVLFCVCSPLCPCVIRVFARKHAGARKGKGEVRERASAR